MSSEAVFIDALRAIATSAAARDLVDDAAVLNIGDIALVLTMDAIVESVHFLPDDPPDTVAWKLVASNVSDLAAKGARPCGCLLTYALGANAEWDAAFVRGLGEACAAFGIPLLGGDTVRQPSGSARSFSLVALGEGRASVPVPSRNGAKTGDEIWVAGPIGDAGLGLAILQGRLTAPVSVREALIRSYRQPSPSPALGMALAPHVTAMMDVSDGLLIDLSRLAAASNVAASVALDKIPLSDAHIEAAGQDLDARLVGASAGDDYCLLFTADVCSRQALLSVAADQQHPISCIGYMEAGSGLSLTFGGQAVAVPERLGFQH